MAEAKRKISKKVKWFAAIGIVLLLIAATFAFVQYVVDDKSGDVKTISKWGVTLKDASADAKFQLSSSSMEEKRHSIGLYVFGTTQPPIAGEKERISMPNVTGVTEKDLYISYDVDVDFPNDSMTKNGKFICPIYFDTINGFTKKVLRVNGKEYSSKTKLVEELARMGDIFMDTKVPAGTDMEKFMKEYNDKCIFSCSADRDFDTKGYQNTKMSLDCKFIIADEPNAWTSD